LRHSNREILHQNVSEFQQHNFATKHFLGKSTAHHQNNIGVRTGKKETPFPYIIPFGSVHTTVLGLATPCLTEISKSWSISEPNVNWGLSWVGGTGSRRSYSLLLSYFGCHLSVQSDKEISCHAMYLVTHRLRFNSMLVVNMSPAGGIAVRRGRRKTWSGSSLSSSRQREEQTSTTGANIRCH